jgi:predicted PhzF superfamily epimerase YddE/YHI9
VAVLHVLRVFTDEDGEHGNLLGVFLEGGEVSRTERQSVAAELGFSETVFVDDAAAGEVQIFTPGAEIPFAGHPVVGTAWLLSEARRPADVLRPPPGEVPVREEGGLTYATAPAEWCPDFDYIEHPDAASIEALDPASAGNDDFHWAWIDREAGTVRARGFYPGWGIPEDEATGSAVLALCVALDRPIEVRQGEGSLIRARPMGGGRAEIAGSVSMVERRDY